MKTSLSIIVIVFFIGAWHFSFCQTKIFTNKGKFTLKANYLIFKATKWQNNGTPNLKTGTTVSFKGNADQYIDGTQSTSFANLTINNSGTHGVIVNKNIQVLGTLNLLNGHFDLKNSIVDLSTSGTVIGEAEAHRIRATDASWNDGGGTGIIRATRHNPSGNVAGLGLDFTPSSALGNNTIIERGCNKLQGSGSYTGNYSIFRWYKITPGNSISPLTINKFYYWGGTGNPELNGHTEANLQMFQQVQYYNGSTNPIYWEPRNSSVNTGSDYVSSTTTNNPIMLNYILVTLGSTDKPLPVEYLSFKAFCNNSINTITWQTASENNNLGFNIEKSNDGIEWENIGFVAGNGNTNAVSSYQFNDNSPFIPVTYYRLQQIDFDGQTKYSNIISTTCNQENVDEEIIPMYNNGQLELTINGNINNHYSIIVTNAIGQLIVLKHIQLENPLQSISIISNLADGVYYISLVSEKSIISKPLIVHK